MAKQLVTLSVKGVLNPVMFGIIAFCTQRYAGLFCTTSLQYHIPAKMFFTEKLRKVLIILDSCAGIMKSEAPLVKLPALTSETAAGVTAS